LIKHYNSPFAVETAHIKVCGTDLLRAGDPQPFSDTARQYRESYRYLRREKSVEWPLIEHGRWSCTLRKSRSRRFPRR